MMENDLHVRTERRSREREELRGLRNFNPRTAATRALFDDDAPTTKPNGHAPTPGSPNLSKGGGPNLAKGSDGSATPMIKPVAEPLAKNERPPIDPDAT